MNTLKYMRHFQRSTYAQLADLAVPSEVQNEMAAIMNNFLSGVIERKLNAPDFLKQINRKT